MALRALLFVQALLLVVVLFGDIGFDRPGRFGLDFGHLILIALVYVVTLIAGCVYAAKKRKRAMLVAQVLLPVIASLYAMRPLPYYDSAEYQHLVGMPMDEVESMLNFRGAWTSYTKREGSTVHHSTLSGMEIWYSVDRIVLGVVRATKR